MEVLIGFVIVCVIIGSVVGSRLPKVKTPAERSADALEILAASALRNEMMKHADRIMIDEFEPARPKPTLVDSRMSARFR